MHEDFSIRSNCSTGPDESTEQFFELFEHSNEDEFNLFGCTISWLTFALSILGVLTNAMSIYIYTHRVMRSPVNVLLGGLSAIDLVLSACCIPSYVVPMWLQCYEVDILLTLTNVFGAVVYPVTMMSQTASIWTFLIIAFDRWIAVCHPLKARWSTIERSYRALCAVIIGAVAYNAVRFFEHRLIIVENDEIELHVLLKNETAHPAYMPVYYVGFYLVTHFIGPFSILIYVNLFMIISIVKARRQRLMLGRRQKSEHKTTIMMGVVVFVFLLTNTLPFVLNFVEFRYPNYFYDEETKPIGFALLDLGNFLVVVNASTTAFIYYACSQRYRRLFVYIWHRLLCGYRYFPSKYFGCCCEGVSADISGINGGYSMAYNNVSSNTMLLFNAGGSGGSSGMATTASLCTMAIGQFIPTKYYHRAMSEIRGGSITTMASASERCQQRRSSPTNKRNSIVAVDVDDADLV